MPAQTARVMRLVNIVHRPQSKPLQPSAGALWVTPNRPPDLARQAFQHIHFNIDLREKGFASKQTLNHACLAGDWIVGTHAFD